MPKGGWILVQMQNGGFFVCYRGGGKCIIIRRWVFEGWGWGNTAVGWMVFAVLQGKMQAAVVG